MQFYLNGFRTGDPELSEAGTKTNALAHGGPTPLPHEVDVLIVGCGPPGCVPAWKFDPIPGVIGVQV